MSENDKEKQKDYPRGVIKIGNIRENEQSHIQKSDTTKPAKKEK